MVKYKSRAAKASMTSAEAEEKAHREELERQEIENARLAAEKEEADRAFQLWKKLPGPVPLGWSSAMDNAGGSMDLLEYYWRDDDPATTTWVRPSAAGEQPELAIPQAKEDAEAKHVLSEAAQEEADELKKVAADIANEIQNLTRAAIPDLEGAAREEVNLAKARADSKEATALWKEARHVYEAARDASDKAESALLENLIKELNEKNRPPKEGEWALCLQRVWPKEPTDRVCTDQRPGWEDTDELCQALTLLRYFLRGPRKKYQDLCANCRHMPHSKLPPRMHHASVMNLLVDYLAHDEEDVRVNAACAISAACFGGHRASQDLVFMAGTAMPQLIEMLWDDNMAQAAATCMGRLCENTHRGNQDSILMCKDGVSHLLDLMDHQDEGIRRGVQFCVFWASANSSKGTRTFWERSRGFCMSLTAPKPMVNDMQPRQDHISNLSKERMSALLSPAERRATMAAVNKDNVKRSNFVTMGEKVLALMDAAPEPDDVPFNLIAKKKGKQSRQMHIPVAHNQDPSHSHMHLATRRANDHQVEHQRRHDEAHEEHHRQLAIQNSRPGTADDTNADRKNRKALGDQAGFKMIGDTGDTAASGSICAGQLTSEALALHLNSVGEGAMASAENNALLLGYGEMMKVNSDGGFSIDSEEPDTDVHHLDPGLNDPQLCRIGPEIRHCAPTGFLKPLSVNTRYGMCT